MRVTTMVVSGTRRSIPNITDTTFQNMAMAFGLLPTPPKNEVSSVYRALTAGVGRSPTAYVAWHACEEERILVLPFARLSQLIQIPHLANR